MNDIHPSLSLSIVSHGQLNLIANLLDDLRCMAFENFEVLLTINHPEDEVLVGPFPFPLHIYRNISPKGFGANHNAAFKRSKGEFFVVVNPDIRIKSQNLHDLISPMSDIRVAAVAPVVLSTEGHVEDSARKFPSFFGLICRVLGWKKGLDYIFGSTPLAVEWVAGMFIVFRSTYFEKIHGFDEKRYFMYFEDVDICERFWGHGWSVMLQPSVQVIHNAQRASHRNIKHLQWHLMSCFRYLTKI